MRHVHKHARGVGVCAGVHPLVDVNGGRGGGWCHMFYRSYGSFLLGDP